MTSEAPTPNPPTPNPPTPNPPNPNLPDPSAEKILCPHCQRTATNGIKCKGICVADNEY